MTATLDHEKLQIAQSKTVDVVKAQAGHGGEEPAPSIERLRSWMSLSAPPSTSRWTCPSSSAKIDAQWGSRTMVVRHYLVLLGKRASSEGDQSPAGFRESF